MTYKEFKEDATIAYEVNIYVNGVIINTLRTNELKSKELLEVSALTRKSLKSVYEELAEETIND